VVAFKNQTSNNIFDKKKKEWCNNKKCEMKGLNIKMEFTIKFTWYDDEKIWLATSSSEAFAMTLDHGSFDALLERVKIAMHDIAENELGHKGEVKLKLEIDRTINIDIETAA
jgi:hypothetical protein